MTGEIQPHLLLCWSWIGFSLSSCICTVDLTLSLFGSPSVVLAISNTKQLQPGWSRYCDQSSVRVPTKFLISGIFCWGDGFMQDVSAAFVSRASCLVFFPFFTHCTPRSRGCPSCYAVASSAMGFPTLTVVWWCSARKVTRETWWVVLGGFWVTINQANTIKIGFCDSFELSRLEFRVLLGQLCWLVLWETCRKGALLMHLGYHHHHLTGKGWNGLFVHAGFENLSSRLKLWFPLPLWVGIVTPGDTPTLS